MQNSFGPLFGYGSENRSHGSLDLQEPVPERGIVKPIAEHGNEVPNGPDMERKIVEPVSEWSGRNSETSGQNGGNSDNSEWSGGNSETAENSGKNDKSDNEKAKEEDERIRENGQLTLEGPGKGKIHLLSIIGEIEGHENLSGSTKTTKYEHILPELAKVEDTKEIEGVLVLINTVGGDVSCGLALAEMLASLSKPTVSLVIGDSHSIGVPLAVATDYSFIVPSGTMLVHPVRMSGMLIGTTKTYEYFEMIQDRILGFVSDHSKVSYEELKSMMHSTKMLSKDLGTVLVGKDAVECGLIDAVGGIQEALKKLYSMIEEKGHFQY